MRLQNVEVSPGVEEDGARVWEGRWDGSAVWKKRARMGLIWNSIAVMMCLRVRMNPIIDSKTRGDALFQRRWIFEMQIKHF